jgi:hypothetical protein
MPAKPSGSSAAKDNRSPMRRGRFGCCARAASGQATAAVPKQGDEVAPSHGRPSSRGSAYHIIGTGRVLRITGKTDRQWQSRAKRRHRVRAFMGMETRVALPGMLDHPTAPGTQQEVLRRD